MLQAREELIESVCQKEVGVYQQIFSTTGETALIERAERRYAWLRRRLRAKAEIWAIFPESWRLTQRMCLLFAQATRTQLAEILDNKVGCISTFHVFWILACLLTSHI